MIPIRDAGHVLGVAPPAGGGPKRIGPVARSLPLRSRPIPSAWVSLPGPEQRSSTRSRPRRARMTLQPVERLERADQHRRPHPLGLGHRVQQRVHAVGEVDVGAPRRAEQRGGPRRQPHERVAGRLGLVVGLGLDDHAGRRRRATRCSRPGRGPPRGPAGRRSRAGAGGRHAGWPSSSALRVGELLAHARQRRPALGHLGLQPAALREHGVELVVEHVGVLAPAPRATAPTACGPTSSA